MLDEESIELRYLKTEEQVKIQGCKFKCATRDRVGVATKTLSLEYYETCDKSIRLTS